MAVEAVVSVLLQKVSDMLKEQSQTQNHVIVYEVQQIMKSLNSMRDLISSKEINQNADWYLDVVYNIEDEMEKFTLIVAGRRMVFGFLANHLFLFNNFNSCHKIHHQIKKITTQLMKQRDKTDTESSIRGTECQLLVTSPGRMEELSFSYSCNEEEIQIVGIKERFQQTRRISSFSYIEEELGIFGRQEDFDTLVNKLTNDSGHVVSILGQAGIGKTTFARTIYKHKEIKRHFQFRAWVSVLEKYTTKDILLTLFKATESIMDTVTNTDDENATKLKLSAFFKNKRYLVILDGVSTSNTWEDIKETLPDEMNGSKLVLTSSQIVETPEMNILWHRMMPLNDDDSWKTFKEKLVGSREQSWDLVPEKTKQAILQSCKGLPLNIALLAGLFSMKDPSSWSEILLCKQNSVNILSLCFKDLSNNLKVCLLYSVLFPKDFDIPVRRLLRLWLAEGFVKQNSTNVFPEDIAQTYFEELVNRNMIQISKLRSDNSPRRCRVVGVLHDYLLPKAQETNLFHNYRNLINCEQESSCNVRRMVEYESRKMEQKQGNDRREIFEKENDKETRNQSKVEMSIPSSPMKAEPKSSFFNRSHLRSYTSFNHQKTDYMQAKRIENLLGSIISDGIGLLRVLDLEGVYKPFLPENLGNLCNLRYLGLRSTYLVSLPASIGELTHLETLDLKNTCIEELPCSIWRLKKLYHLNLNEMYPNMNPHSSLRLSTLWGLSLDDKVPIKNGLDKLHNLRELGITFQLSSSSNQDDLMGWISKLTELRSLRLRSKDRHGRPSKLMFRSMSDLGKLSHLNLLGNLERLPSPNEFPPTLKVLTLSISLLKQDPMQVLGELPCLTVLRLLGQSYIGKDIVARKGEFRKLKVLKMWMLQELESWIVEEESMQSLKHLDIRCCDKLRNIPAKLLQQQQLEHVVLTGMPDIFTNEVERSKSDHTSITINHWNFPIPEQEDSTFGEP